MTQGIARRASHSRLVHRLEIGTINKSSAGQSNSGSLVTTSGDIVVSGAQSFTNSNLVQAMTGNVSITGNSAVGSLFSNSAPSASVIAGGNLTIGGFRNIDKLGTFSAGGNLVINGATGSTTVFDHSGSLSAGAGSSFTMTTGNAASQLIIQPGSTFDPGAAMHLTRVKLVLNQGLNLGTTDFNLNSGSVSGTGQLTRANGSSSTLTSSTLTSSTLSAPLDTAGLTSFVGTNSATGTRNFNLPVDNRGSFTLHALTSWNKSGATQNNSGTITAAEAFGLHNARSFTNSGAITSTGGALTLDGNSDPAATFLNTGTITGQNGIAITDFETATTCRFRCRRRSYQSHSPRPAGPSCHAETSAKEAAAP